ncbi:tRNA (adenine57-N1/adenine58-N1)-methyltransferase catalytic subunit [Pseudoscourfieldia marina]
MTAAAAAAATQTSKSDRSKLHHGAVVVLLESPNHNASSNADVYLAASAPAPMTKVKLGGGGEPDPSDVEQTNKKSAAKSLHDGKLGSYDTSKLVGTTYGSRIVAKKTTRADNHNTKKSPGAGRGSERENALAHAVVLPVTCNNYARILHHRTQVLYDADVALIVARLELRPGMVVVESGTGSACLTHALARGVAPTGRVHSFEFHLGRVEEARKDLGDLRLLASEDAGASGARIYHRDVCAVGFPASEPTDNDAGTSLPDAANDNADDVVPYADAGILDLPNPEKAAKSLSRVVRPNSVVCSFSPCVEQVVRASQALVDAGFTDVRVVECLTRSYDVEKNQLMEHPSIGSLAPSIVVDSDDEEKPPKRRRIETLDAEMSDDSDNELAARAKKTEKTIAARRLPCASSVGARLQLDGKGHTGFLVFARKRV